MQKRLLGLSLTAVMIITACGGSTPSASTAQSTEPTTAPSTPASTGPSAEPTPVDYEATLFNYTYTPKEGTAGGSVIIGDWQAVQNLNSYYDNAFTTTQVLAATMRGLWLTSADGHWKPDLAAKMPKFSDQSIRQAADGSFEVDLTLRPGLKWSDGEPLTLNDLKYTWQWNMDPAQSGLVAGTTGWEDISAFDVAADGLSATVKFEQAVRGLLRPAWLSVILPEHYFKTIPSLMRREVDAGEPEDQRRPGLGPVHLRHGSPDGHRAQEESRTSSAANVRPGRLPRLSQLHRSSRTRTARTPPSWPARSTPHSTSGGRLRRDPERRPVDRHSRSSSRPGSTSTWT